MPAVIAVKINNTNIKTQENSSAVKSDKTKNKVTAEGREKNGKVSESDFKKLLDAKIETKKGKKENLSLSSSVKKEKTSAEGKLNTEKLPDLKAEKVSDQSEEKTEKSETDNFPGFDMELKTADGKSEKITAEKTSANQVFFPAVSGLSESGKSEKNGKALKNPAEKKDSENENLTKKSQGANKEEARFQVLDLRSSEKNSRENSFSGSEGSNEKSDAAAEISEQKTGSSDLQIKDSLFIKADNAGDARSENPVKSLTAQQAAVLDKLKNDGNAEIIKQTKMVLSDNNSGELRMVLKPESLGFVRIKLNLDDNNIVGRIIVDNNSIKEIFENNMDNLLRNFRESGFSSASLEVSVGGEKGRQQNMDSNERFFSRKIIEDVDSQNIIGSSTSNADALIDLVV